MNDVVEDQQKHNAQGVLVYPLSDDSSTRFAHELRIKHNRPDPGPGDIQGKIRFIAYST